jgi:protein-S-isoprenylcysteine O-methyltransferase Ste14
MNWKWSNVPIPLQHLLGLLLGGLLQALFRQRLFTVPWIGHVLGWPMVAVGMGLSAWSVVEAGNVDVEAPTKLLTTGPYAKSRNPMYVGWALIYLGTALVANSIWMIALFPIVIVYTHVVDVRKEERFLATKFGDEFREYQRRVPRYL